MSKFNENTLAQQPLIDWLKELGYDYEFGPDLAPGAAFMERDSFHAVILISRLKRSLKRLNPSVSDKAIDDAAATVINFEHPNLENANREIYKMLIEGIKIEVRHENGETRGEIIKVFDFENPTNNEFLAVEEFTVQGAEAVRRPDVTIFINGIPLAIFELKSPTSQSGTIRTAFDQLQKYKADIPAIFKYNQILVVSDLTQARHGTLNSPWERFSAWKGIDSEDEKHPKGTTELEILVKGIFQKSRLVDIIQNFIVFEADSEKDVSAYAKKMCLYHQYFGVNRAAQETLRATSPKGNKRIGVFWHTQGSGKSISMVFYINKIKQFAALKSPTVVFLTDRNDLDGQLYKTFLRTGYPTAKQAQSTNDLRERLKTAAGELIFTTIQKFFSGKDEEYDLLSPRDNIIVIADEAHRSQYAQFAGNVRKALPNASFMGITGTPISVGDHDTRLVFGDYISAYQIDRAVQDGATVPIYYEGRLVPLHLTSEFVDEEFEGVVPEYEFDTKEKLKRKWAKLEELVGVEDRLQKVAKDIVEHFNNRGLIGKAMIVTMSRRIAVQMYKIIKKIEGSPDVAVVISKTEDFKDEIQKEVDVKELEKKFKDPSDSLRIVIVCDMWLTGFDVPVMHTMYIDKPLKNHGLMQAIARVNRVYKDKEGGLIVDYIGVADNIKQALSFYSSDMRKQAMIPIDEIVNKMMEKYDVVRSMFSGLDLSKWKKLEPKDRSTLFAQALEGIITDPVSGRLNEDRKSNFLKESEQLAKLFALVMPHHSAIKIKNEVEFFQAIMAAFRKRITAHIHDIDVETESTIREIISKSIAAEGVIDIFSMKDKTKPNISIFDEKFLEEVKNMKFKNLAIEVLRKLLQDDLRSRKRKNEIRYKSLYQLLEEIIEEYENNIINSSKVIEKLIELARDIKAVGNVGISLGLSDEELAFYDAIADGKTTIQKDEKLKAIVKELVSMIRRELGVDWTNNEIIKAKIRANARRLLLRNSFSTEDSELLIERIYNQAAILYQNYISTVTV